MRVRLHKPKRLLKQTPKAQMLGLKPVLAPRQTPPRAVKLGLAFKLKSLS